LIDEFRQGQETPQKVLFQKAKFASFLAENFICTSADEDRDNKELVKKKFGIRGLLMNCANAIRLQISTQTPTSFLVNFLSNHGKWNEFINELTVSNSEFFCFQSYLKI
jgi:chemotaxis methyl-accepting protein methylase